MPEVYHAITPQKESLKKYIDRYYFHSSDNPAFERSFIYYPSHRTALNIYKNVSVALHQEGRIYVPNDRSELEVVFTNGCSRSKKVQLKGSFEKIGVLFHSLGFNHFIDIHLHDLLGSAHAIKTDIFGNGLLNTAHEVFHTNDLNGKRDVLDTFFSSRLMSFDDKRFSAILSEIHRRKGHLRLEELAENFQISRKTIGRAFRQHLDFSFRDYVGTLRFRNALDEFYDSKAIKLVQIAYNNNYYDQAGFNKHFKSLAQLNPKALFAQIQKREGKVYWNYQNS